MLSEQKAFYLDCQLLRQEGKDGICAYLESCKLIPTDVSNAYDSMN